MIKLYHLGLIYVIKKWESGTHFHEQKHIEAFSGKCSLFKNSDKKIFSIIFPKPLHFPSETMKIFTYLVFTYILGIMLPNFTAAGCCHLQILIIVATQTLILPAPHRIAGLAAPV